MSWCRGFGRKVSEIKKEFLRQCKKGVECQGSSAHSETGGVVAPD